MAPEGWRRAKIAEIARVTSGGTPSIGRADYYGGDVPFLKIDDITQNGRLRIDRAKTSITQRALQETSAKLYPRDAVLLTMYGTIGAVAVLDRPMAANQAIGVLLDLQGVLPDFMAYRLAQDADVLRGKAGHTTQSNISGQILKAHEVLLPPLAEQRKIAAILSSVDETIEKTEAVIAQLDVVKKAMLEELLTRGIPGRHSRFKQTEIGEVPEEWSLVPLETIGSQIGSLWSDGDWIESKDQDPTGGIRLLQVGNVRRGSVHLGGSPRWINAETFKRLGCTEVRSGDILISRMADPIGRAGIVPALPFKALTAVDCAILRVDPTRVVASYIVNYLNAPRTLARVASLATGTTRARVSRTTLGLLPVPLPALDEQRALAHCFDAVDQRQQSEVAARVELMEVKSALSSALLSGDLRVRPSGGAA